MLDEVPVIIVSNTFSRESEVALYIELAKINDYDVTVMILENRHGNKSIHSVPDTTLEKQELNIKNSLKLRWKKNLNTTATIVLTKYYWI